MNQTILIHQLRSKWQKKPGRKNVNLTKNQKADLELINAVRLYSSTPQQAEKIKSLLQKKDPNVQDQDGRTALIWASFKNYPKIVKILLEDKRTNPNIADEDQWTPLIWAGYTGHIKTVKLLLADERTNPNTQGTYGGTALNMGELRGPCSNS